MMGWFDNYEHWHVKAPLRDVRFRGLPAVRLERWNGKSSGVSGWLLDLAAPLAEAQRHLDESGFKQDESGNFKPELNEGEKGRRTHLVCNVSM